VLTTDHPAEVGSALCASPLVRKLSFTGSTAVGKLLLRQCADTVKKVSLELGGNAPFIVFDDADLDAAVEGAVVSKFRNAGQTCVCANRLYVQAGVYDAFMARFKAAVATLKVGDGMAADVALGPVIDHRALQKIQGMLDDALAQGATLEQGGQVLVPGSTLLVPTILGGAHAGMRLAHEEVFGPVAPVFRFDTEAEVIALANDTDYGLAAYFYGRDIGRIWRVAEALEYGMVGINTGLISTAVAPFGGVKQSGMGREGSKYGLEDYMEVKYLCFGL
jgi:succinate-semialdehyde dehydrogenase/glutarate-semialdehyde dehydrogenase